jgi:hypothetical protein
MNILASAKQTSFISDHDKFSTQHLRLVKETSKSSDDEFELQLDAVFTTNGLVAEIKLNNH